MKTLKKLMLITFFAGMVLFVQANENYVKKYEIVPFQELRSSVLNFIKSDFVKEGNYFYKNNIDKFKSDVTVVFYVSSENRIQLLNAESENKIAVEYIQQLLDEAKIKLAEDYQNKKFKLTLKLDYRT